MEKVDSILLLELLKYDASRYLNNFLLLSIKNTIKF